MVSLISRRELQNIFDISMDPVMVPLRSLPNMRMFFRMTFLPGYFRFHLYRADLDRGKGEGQAAHGVGKRELADLERCVVNENVEVASLGKVS